MPFLRTELGLGTEALERNVALFHSKLQINRHITVPCWGGTLSRISLVEVVNPGGPQMYTLGPGVQCSAVSTESSSVLSYCQVRFVRLQYCNTRNIGRCFPVLGAVQCSAVQCSAVQCSAVQCLGCGPGRRGPRVAALQGVPGGSSLSLGGPGGTGSLSLGGQGHGLRGTLGRVGRAGGRGLSSSRRPPAAGSRPAGSPAPGGGAAAGGGARGTAAGPAGGRGARQGAGHLLVGQAGCLCHHPQQGSHPGAGSYEHLAAPMKTWQPGAWCSASGRRVKSPAGALSSSRSPTGRGAGVAGTSCCSRCRSEDTRPYSSRFTVMQYSPSPPPVRV
jgi:hypothetical protein